jgi:hypothetical protein
VSPTVAWTGFAFHEAMSMEAPTSTTKTCSACRASCGDRRPHGDLVIHHPISPSGDRAEVAA